MFEILFFLVVQLFSADQIHVTDGSTREVETFLSWNFQGLWGKQAAMGREISTLFTRVTDFQLVSFLCSYPYLLCPS